MNPYLIWVPYITVYFAIAAAISKKINDHPQAGSYFIICLVLNALSVWPFIAKYSKSILFDAVLYDTICTLVYFGTLVALGCGKGFSTTQWFALGLVLIGLLLLKVS
jgi:hypothetical protein